MLFFPESLLPISELSLYSRLDSSFKIQTMTYLSFNDFNQFRIPLSWLKTRAAAIVLLCYCVTQTLRVAREGSIEDERQPRTHSCPSQQRPAPAACCEETLRSVTVVSLHAETRVSISAGCARRRTPKSVVHFQQLPRTASPRCLAFDMTFRRLKKVNSSGPDAGAASQDGDIYFPSSKSDSCRTAGFPTNSSEVYNYRTLAYSGGTLPRNFKKVKVNANFITSLDI